MRRPRVTAGVAILQPAGEHNVERRARHDAELAGGGHGPRQRPGRDGHAHAALNESGQRADARCQHGTSKLRLRRLR